MIQQLKRCDLNCNIFDVYDYDGASMQELLCEFFTKINECIDASNKSLNLVDWLVNEGLALEIAKKLELWLLDGTLAEIINETLFNSLNEKIDSVVDVLDTKVNKDSLAINVNDYGIYGDGETDITEKLNNLISSLSNYIWSVNNENTYGNSKPLKLYFPRGKYLISNTINLSPYITIEGEFTSLGNNYKIKELNSGLTDFSENGTSFVCDFKTNRNFAFNISSYHSNGVRDTDIERYYNGPQSKLYDRLEGVTLKNIQIIANNYLFGALYCVGSPFLTLENVNVIGADIGIYMSSLWNGRIKNSGFHCKNYGVIGFRDINNVSFDGCSIEHYYMYKGNGDGDRVYNNSNLNILYPPEGNHMPTEYVSYTTAIYLRNCWQISFTNCTIQNYHRGVYCFQTNMLLNTIWFENIQKIDVHTTHSTVNIASCRKETTENKLIRATGKSIITVNNLSGSDSRGTWVDNNDVLIEYKDSNAIVNFIGCPSDDCLGSSPFNVDGIKFNGYNTISRLVKTNITPLSEQV